MRRDWRRRRLKGQVPARFVVLTAGAERARDEIAAEVIRLVRDRIGLLASFKTVIVVERLPKTRSGRSSAGRCAGSPTARIYATPATIEDPAALGEVQEALAGAGYAGPGVAAS